MQNNGTYIIGEIGQNHNGSVDLAKLLIEVASRPVIDTLFGLKLKPMDAVKLTKRDLNEELSFTQMNEPYNSPHSFGETYGKHRQKLELNDEQHFELYKYAKLKGLDLVETLCAKGCLSIFKYFTPDKLKVASRDLTNLPLLEAMSETKVHIILSTGMAGEKEIDDAIEVITKYHDDFSILHCVSQYPTDPRNANLKSITYLKNKFPNITIGYSDHTIGISAPIAAVAMGAKIIEKHITIDRHMKGTDQAGSLGMEGISRMVRDIRLMELSLGEEKVYIDDAVEFAKKKLERSIASNKKIEVGQIITSDDIHLLSPGDGYKWAQKEDVIGKVALQNIDKDEIIYSTQIK